MVVHVLVFRKVSVAYSTHAAHHLAPLWGRKPFIRKDLDLKNLVKSTAQNPRVRIGPWLQTGVSHRRGGTSQHSPAVAFRTNCFRNRSHSTTGIFHKLTAAVRFLGAADLFLSLAQDIFMCEFKRSNMSNPWLWWESRSSSQTSACW